MYVLIFYLKHLKIHTNITHNTNFTFIKVVKLVM